MSSNSHSPPASCLAHSACLWLHGAGCHMACLAGWCSCYEVRRDRWWHEVAPCHTSCTHGLAGLSRRWMEVGRQRVQQAGAAAMRGVKTGGGVGVAPHGPDHVPPRASAFATLWLLHAQFLPSNPIQAQPWSCPMCLHPCISGDSQPGWMCPTTYHPSAPGSSRTGPGQSIPDIPFCHEQCQTGHMPK